MVLVRKTKATTEKGVVAKSDLLANLDLDLVLAFEWQLVRGIVS